MKALCLLLFLSCLHSAFAQCPNGLQAPKGFMDFVKGGLNFDMESAENPTGQARTVSNMKVVSSGYNGLTFSSTEQHAFVVQLQGLQLAISFDYQFAQQFLFFSYSDAGSGMAQATGDLFLAFGQGLDACDASKVVFQLNLASRMDGLRNFISNAAVSALNEGISTNLRQMVCERVQAHMNKVQGVSAVPPIKRGSSWAAIERNVTAIARRRVQKYIALVYHVSDAVHQRVKERFKKSDVDRGLFFLDPLASAALNTTDFFLTLLQEGMEKTMSAVEDEKTRTFLTPMYNLLLTTRQSVQMLKTETIDPYAHETQLSADMLDPSIYVPWGETVAKSRMAIHREFKQNLQAVLNGYPLWIANNIPNLFMMAFVWVAKQYKNDQEGFTVLVETLYQATVELKDAGVLKSLVTRVAGTAYAEQMNNATAAAQNAMQTMGSQINGGVGTVDPSLFPLPPVGGVDAVPLFPGYAPYPYPPGAAFDAGNLRGSGPAAPANFFGRPAAAGP